MRTKRQVYTRSLSLIPDAHPLNPAVLLGREGRKEPWRGGEWPCLERDVWKPETAEYLPQRGYILNQNCLKWGLVSQLSVVTDKMKSCASVYLYPNVSTSQQLQEPLWRFQRELLLFHIPIFLGKATPKRQEVTVVVTNPSS